jgi:hypothetical protein
MSCCGSRRATIRQDWGPVEQNDGQYWVPDPVEFEYTGFGELTVTGPLTGIEYRFTANDRRARVHGSDAPSFLAVPGLRPAH